MPSLRFSSRVLKLSLAVLGWHSLSVIANDPVSSLPPSAAYVYATPALYLNWGTVEALGNLSTGGTQLLGPIVEGHLYSEPGFELKFSGAVKNAADYLTVDPDGITARPAVTAEIVPDNGHTPLLMRIGGIDQASAQAAAIFTSGTSEGRAVPYGFSYSVWTPTFFGGSAKYAVLQNSVFVGSETMSDSDTPGSFRVGIKIAKISPVNTTITIGNEVP